MGERDFPMGLYRFLRALARVIVRLLFRYSVRGLEHVPAQGGCILAVNHMSFWDPLFLALCAPKRYLTFLARTSLFSKPLVGFCLREVGAVAVNRDKNDFSALRTALAVLKEGKVIGIYPQGTRCPDVSPDGTAFEGGAAYMAMTAGVPIIPIGVATKNYRVRWFRKVNAVIGEPLYFERTRGREAIEAYAEKVKNRICALCREALSDAGGETAS